MSLVEVKWAPKDKVLRQFGWICLVGFPLIAWLFSGRPWPNAMTTGQSRFLIIMAIIGAVLAVIGTARPQALKWVYIGLTLITIPIGLVIGEVMFATMFFLIFTPVALFFKLTGRDVLHRRFDKAKASYWEPKVQPADARRYFRQY